MLHFFNEGNPIYMIPLLLLLLFIIGLVIKGHLKEHSEKNNKLIASLSLFSLVFGIFSFLVGLHQILDAVGQATDIAPQVLAIGFKVGMIPPTFGVIVFLIGRAGMISLLLKKK